jgi:hypothetical protein
MVETLVIGQIYRTGCRFRKQIKWILIKSFTATSLSVDAIKDPTLRLLHPFNFTIIIMKLLLAALSLSLASATDGLRKNDRDLQQSSDQLGLKRTRHPDSRQLGPRPFWMVEQMEDSPLKERLTQ